MPTQSPIVHIGGCPDAYSPSNPYLIGARVESGGTVYRCKIATCAGVEPLKGIWRDVWDIMGTCSGTFAPSPSTVVGSPPCPVEEDFNVCIALDMSGSVCNGGVFDFCFSCETDICNKGGFDQNVCCPNFNEIIQFSTSIVSALDHLPMNQAFSLVQFSDDAQLLSSSTTARNAKADLLGLSYTGGRTNTYDALLKCQSSFISPDSKNFVIIITDGVPSLPFPDPRDNAIAQAESMKILGTTIIPVFIETADSFGRGQEFMSQISSDGNVLDVTAFDDLDNLRETLLDQITCN